MKKMLFGAALLCSGVIGFAAWAIACVCANGGMSALSPMLYAGNFGITAVFSLMAVIGLVICLQEWRAL